MPLTALAARSTDWSSGNNEAPRQSCNLFCCRRSILVRREWSTGPPGEVVFARGGGGGEKKEKGGAAIVGGPETVADLASEPVLLAGNHPWMPVPTAETISS